LFGFRGGDVERLSAVYTSAVEAPPSEGGPAAAAAGCRKHENPGRSCTSLARRTGKQSKLVGQILVAGRPDRPSGRATRNLQNLQPARRNGILNNRWPWPGPPKPWRRGPKAVPWKDKKAIPTHTIPPRRAFMKLAQVGTALAATLLLAIAPAWGQDEAKKDEKVDFAKQIQPILVGRCLKCHGPESPKGSFSINKKDLAMQGGELGDDIVPGKPDESFVIDLITLPADDESRMPAEGEPLSEEQIELIRKWIEQGAEWPDDLELKAPEEGVKKDDPLAGPGVEITPAEEAAVAKARELGALALRIAQNTNWLRVDFSLGGKDVTDDDLVILKDMPNLVELDLGGTKVTDKGLEHLAGLTNMVRLHLERTAITGSGLVHLKDMAKLNYLNLYGTQVTDEALEPLKGLPKLRKLYLWQAQVTGEGAAKLKEAIAELDINLGIEEKPAEPEKAEEAKPAEEAKKEETKEEKKEEAKKDEAKKDEAKPKEEKKEEAKKDEAKPKEEKKEEAKKDEAKPKEEKKEEAKKDEAKPKEEKKEEAKKDEAKPKEEKKEEAKKDEAKPKEKKEEAKPKDEKKDDQQKKDDEKKGDN
jgi:mono/diheme cytochrome c family protein